MRDDYDIEDAMRRYEAQPSARVKQSVLARFGAMRHAGTAHGSAPGFWKQRVPLYAVAAALVIVVGLSFAAGRSMSRAGDHGGSTTGPASEKSLTSSPAAEWVAAENDLL